MLNVLLTGLYVLTSLADTYTTYLGLKKGDTEAAPVAKTFFHKLGFLKGAELLKGIGLAVILGATYFDPKQVWILSSILDIGGVAVVVHNLKVLRK